MKEKIDMINILIVCTIAIVSAFLVGLVLGYTFYSSKLNDLIVKAKMMNRYIEYNIDDITYTLEIVDVKVKEKKSGKCK